MAYGGVVSGIADITNGGNLDYQPASGVEVLIKAVVFEGDMDQLSVGLYDGTNYAGYNIMGPNAAAAGVIHPHNLQMFITNGVYLRLTQASGGTLAGGYTGLQTNS